MRTTLFVLILGLVASTVYASDGVFEINADCAVFGCFDGDSSGYPVTITNPGSYRLTGNLTTSNVDTTLISVSADSVTIDLNGFALIGPVTCSGNPNVCSGSGTGNGIFANDPVKAFKVFNGTVRGLGNDGIVIGTSSSIENVRVIENGNEGILQDGFGTSMAINIVAYRNGANGVRTVGGRFGTSMAINIVAYRNGANGVRTVGGRIFVIDSSLNFNTEQGQSFGSCSNIYSINNGENTFCIGIAPNVCEDPAGCD